MYIILPEHEDLSILAVYWLYTDCDLTLKMDLLPHPEKCMKVYFFVSAAHLFKVHRRITDGNCRKPTGTLLQDYMYDSVFQLGLEKGRVQTKLGTI